MTPAETPAAEVARPRARPPRPSGGRLEALEVQPELLGALPQVRVVQVALVGVQRVVHLPEAPLQRRRLRRRGQPPRARVLRDDREVAEDQLTLREQQLARAQYGHS